MPIHPVLVPGLEAYLRGDYVQALIAWEEPWKELAGDEKRLSLALVRLAGALHHQSGKRRDSAVHLFDSCRQVLAELPAAVLGVDVDRLRRDLPSSVEDALARPPRPRPAARVPRRLVLRFAALVVILVGGFALLRWPPVAQYLTQAGILRLQGRLQGTWWAPVALLAAYAILSPLGLPASPLMLAGGMLFGTVMGSLYNLLGLVLGGATTYGLGRLLGRDLIVHLAGPRVKKVERAISKHGGFWGMVSLRFFPLPYFLVNYCAAFAGISFPLFIGSTAFGLCITVPIYTYFADTLTHAASSDRAGVILKFVIAVILLLALTLSPRAWQARKRRERYRRVTAERKGRAPR